MRGSFGYRGQAVYTGKELFVRNFFSTLRLPLEAPISAGNQPVVVNQL